MSRSRSVALLPLLSILAACANSPESYMGAIAPPGDGDAYNCAVQLLNLLGYTIEQGDRDAGFVRGREQTSGTGTLLFTGRRYHDLITAAVFENPNTQQTTLRVTVGQVDESVGLFGSDEQVRTPSDSGRADAHELLAQVRR